MYGSQVGTVPFNFLNNFNSNNVEVCQSPDSDSYSDDTELENKFLCCVFTNDSSRDCDCNLEFASLKSAAIV